MGFEKTNVELETLTPELAATWAALPPLPGERDIKAGRQAQLLNHLRDGTFCGTVWAKGICRGDGVTYRLDGQHSSKMLSTLPETVPFPVGLHATVETYTFDSVKDDGFNLFNLFNNPISVRNNVDAMGMFRAQVPALELLDKKFLVRIANGIYEYEKGLPKGKVYGPRDRGLYYAETPEYREFALWVAEISGTGTVNRDLLTYTGVVAEMLTDRKQDPEKAEEFWSYVLKDSHPDAGHPTRELVRTFKQWQGSKRYTSEHYRRKAATTWKYYVREMRTAA